MGPPTYLCGRTRPHRFCGGLKPVKSLIPDRKALAASFGLFLMVVPCASVKASVPQIETQPQSTNVIVGSNAAFKVIANGNPTPTYRWMFNGANLTNSAHLSGVTSATLTVSNVTTTDKGTYNVVVSNSHGSVLSSNAVLSVVFRPAITV